MTKRTSTTPKPTAEEWQRALDNDGLVWRHVNRRQSLTEDERENAYQAGMIGLVRAAQLFDESKGFTFATYADAWIVQAIGRSHIDRKQIDRAKSRGEVYSPPLSISMPLNEDGVTLENLMQADEPTADDLAAELDSSDRFSWVLCQLRAGAVDAVDHALIDGIELGDAPASRELGAAHGISGQAVRVRLANIRRRAAELYAIYGDGR